MRPADPSDHIDFDIADHVATVLGPARPMRLAVPGPFLPWYRAAASSITYHGWGILNDPDETELRTELGRYILADWVNRTTSAVR